MKENDLFSVVRRGVLPDSCVVGSGAPLCTDIRHAVATRIQQVMEQAVWRTRSDHVVCARRFTIARLECPLDGDSVTDIFDQLLRLECGVPGTLDQLDITVRADPEALRHGPLVALNSELKRGKTMYSPVAFWTGQTHGKTVFSMTPSRTGGWFRGTAFLLVEGS